MISAVIRACNEELWLNRCLCAVSNQRLPVDDIIIVDNDSTDRTRMIAESYDTRVVSISREDFSFGRALNIGIDAARNDIVLIVSAHCIPVDELWSSFLAIHLGTEADESVCGVYGKQEPLPDTSDIDARDLYTTFREERFVQHRDFFFHNANSAIRKSLWEKYPFDEELRGVEDRAWAKTLTAAGYKVVYEPDARVYHHHGIHQNLDAPRAKRVVESIRYIRDHL